MTEIPADAQRSEDGNYWWDGSEWQLIDQSQAAGGQGEQAGEEGQPQETEPRQTQIAAAGESGGEAQAPDVQIA